MGELQLPDGCNQGDNKYFARVVRHVLTPAECAELISCINRKGFTPALVNIGEGRQQLATETRDTYRVIVDNEPLSSYLMEVLREHLPQKMMGRQGSLCRIEELNERCRFLCYTPGQVFERHYDGMYIRPDEHLKGCDFSRVTVQLYLHDVPEENGGATTFIGDTDVLGVQPMQGSCLLFTQDLYHEGSKLTSGLKYTMRTEVMYTDQDPEEPLTDEGMDAFLKAAEAYSHPQRLEWAKKRARSGLLGGMVESIELPRGSTSMHNARVTLRPAKNAWELAQCVPPAIGCRAVQQLMAWQPDQEGMGSSERHALKRKREDSE